MSPSDDIRKFIEGMEGLRLIAYQDPVGIWTIGYGHTPATPGQHITQEQADKLMSDDLNKFAIGVAKLLSGVPTTQHQFDAMVSLAYNIGLWAFTNSTVLRMHRAKDYKSAATAFSMWNKGGGKILPGLVRRRALEAEWYLKP